MICVFCPSKRAKPRAYHFAGQTALVSTCANCDAKSRTQLALGESKITMPCNLGVCSDLPKIMPKIMPMNKPVTGGTYARGGPRRKRRMPGAVRST